MLVENNLINFNFFSTIFFTVLLEQETTRI